MYARKRLDIGWIDLASGLSGCVLARDREAIAERVERWFSPEGSALCTLSVRSGLDLYLQTLSLPPGSEILFSALTIPDMWRIVQHHDLVPVPVDVDPRTLAPVPGAIERAATPRTRALVLAHLFGTRVPLDPFVELCRARGWRLLEDCAQAFTGPEFKGDERADVSMFSFGPIKTAAALAGGVLVVRDAGALRHMRALHATWPVQETGPYARRILKDAGLKALSTRALYSGFVRACSLCGKDHDRVIQGTVRGFAGADLFAGLRRQPSAALCALIERRLLKADRQRIEARCERARLLCERIGPQTTLPGSAALFHSYWVFVVAVDDPDGLVGELRRAGFDATRMATLSAVPAPAGRPELEPVQARSLLERLVYLPVYPELSEADAERLGRLVRERAGGNAFAPGAAAGARAAS